MKKVLALVLSFVMLNAHADVKDALEEIFPAPEVIAYGNMNNWGYAAIKDGWIYYSSNDDCFYRIREDGTGKTKLSDSRAAFINIVGDWIYYNYFIHDVKRTGIYKMRTDGSDETLVIDDWASYLTVSDGWIYYGMTYGESDKRTGVYKARLDGSGKKQLTSGINPCYLNVAGDWIYYVERAYFDGELDAGTYGDLYRVRTNGKGNALVYKAEEVGGIGGINVAGDWIYYAEKYGGSICKMRADCTEKTVLAAYVGANFSGNNVNVADGWVYYEGDYDAERPRALYKIRTDGTENTLLDANSVRNVIIIGDLIYYYKYGAKWGWYIMRTDGTEKQLLN